MAGFRGQSPDSNLPAERNHIVTAHEGDRALAPDRRDSRIARLGVRCELIIPDMAGVFFIDDFQRPVLVPFYPEYLDHERQVVDDNSFAFARCYDVRIIIIVVHARVSLFPSDVVAYARRSGRVNVVGGQVAVDLSKQNFEPLKECGVGAEFRYRSATRRKLTSR